MLNKDGDKQPATVEKLLVDWINNWINKRLPTKIGGITFYPPDKVPEKSEFEPVLPNRPEEQTPTPPREEDPMAASRRSDILRIVVVVVLGVLVYGAYRYFVR